MANHFYGRTDKKKQVKKKQLINKKPKEKTYLNKWEKIPGFQCFTRHRTKTNKAWCILCKIPLEAANYLLKKHSRRKHEYLFTERMHPIREEEAIIEDYKARHCETNNIDDNQFIQKHKVCCKNEINNPPACITIDVASKEIKNEPQDNVLKYVKEEARHCAEDCCKSGTNTPAACVTTDIARKAIKSEPHECVKEEEAKYSKQDLSNKEKPKDLRKFNPTWLRDPKYKSWCRPVPHSDTQVLCIKCRHTMVARAWYLNKHVESPYHQFNADDIIVPGKDFDENTAEMELKWAAMIADLNFSHLGSEKLSGFLKNAVNDSEKLRNAVLNRKRMLAIQKRIIAPGHQKRLAQILRNSIFAIEIDEATDVSTDHSMCIVVRYYDQVKKKVRETLWDIRPLYIGDENATADAQTIFENICASFAEWDIPLKNIFAFCSDTCSVMVGSKNSVAELLKKEIPGILIVKCDCHIEHLCAQDATSKVPYNNFPSMVYGYLNSSKKKHMWQVCQIKLQLSPLKILKPTCIRWLSHYACILRLLRRWKALTVFFENEVAKNAEEKSEDNASIEIAIEILEQLRDPVNKAYHMFLEAQLSKLVKTNEILQSEKPIIPKSMSKMQELYINLLNMYMEKKYIEGTPLRDIDPTNKQQFRNIADINIGYHAQQHLKKEAVFNAEVEINFKTTCQQFYIEACSKLRRRCNFQRNDSFIGKFFNAENASDPQFHIAHPNLNEVFEACPAVVTPGSEMSVAINNEWNRLSTYNFPGFIFNERNHDTFWSKMREVEEEGQFLFQNVATFALNILCIPNSNAAPERVWSKLNLEKTKIRNRLDISSVRAILLTAQYVHDEGGIKFFQPTREMINRMARPIGVHVPNPKLSFPTHKLSNGEVQIYYGKLKYEQDTAEECSVEDRLYRSPYTDSYLEEDLTIYTKEISIVQDLKKKSSDNLKRKHPVDKIKKSMIKKIKVCENKHLLRLIYQHDHRYLKKKEALLCIQGNSNVQIKKSKMKKIKVCENEHVLRLIYEHDHRYLKKKEALLCIEGNANVPAIYPNGIHSDVEKYRNVEPQILIGLYSTIKDHPMRDYRPTVIDMRCEPDYGEKDHKFALFSSDFKTLFRVGIPGYIEGQIIDAFCAVRERLWKDAYCCPVFLSQWICTWEQSDQLDVTWPLFFPKPNFKGIVFFPYTTGIHWRLFVVNIRQKQAWHLDPYFIDDANKHVNDPRHHGEIPINEESRTAAQTCFDNFMAYCQRMNGMNISNTFSKNSWSLTSYTAPRPTQNDDFNCGVLCMQYMDCLGRGVSMVNEKPFDPACYRSWIIRLLLYNADVVTTTCLFCYRSEAVLGFVARCSECNRGMHDECLITAKLARSEKCMMCMPPQKQIVKVKNQVSTCEPIITNVDDKTLENNANKSKFANCKKDCKENHLLSYPNGLSSNIENYKNVEHRITVGRYSSIENHPIRDYRPQVARNLRNYQICHKFELFSSEFQKLFGSGEAGYISGELIDAFCAIREHKWRNVYACPVNLSSLLFSTWNEQPPSDECTLFHIKPDFKGKILFFYALQRHWHLFVADVHKKQCWHLDPLYIEKEGVYKNDLRNIGITGNASNAGEDRRTRAQICFDNFMAYCKRSKNIKLNTFNKNSWTLTSMPSPRDLQTDVINCGIYVLQYADRIGRGVPLQSKKHFNPVTYRSWIANLLLENSDPMTSTCLFCFSAKERPTIKCSKCNRSMHTLCLKNRNILIANICVLCSSPESNPDTLNNFNQKAATNPS